MRGTAILGLCAAALITAQAGAATLFDSGGFNSYTSGAGLAGQDGWVGGVAPDGANIGAGIGDLGGGDLYAYLYHGEAAAGAYGVWSHSLAPTADPIVSTTWWQYVNGGSFGVMLYDGANPVAGVELGADTAGHQYKLDIDFTANTATLFVDGVFNTSFATIGSTSVSSVGLVAFTPTGFGYFDDLAVTSVPEPGIIALGIGSAVLMLPRRRAAKTA